MKIISHFFIFSPLASILLFDFFSDVSRIAARCLKINCYCSNIKSQISIFNKEKQKLYSSVGICSLIDSLAGFESTVKVV